MNIGPVILALASIGIGLFLLSAQIRLNRRIRRLEAYEAKRRERLHRLNDSDVAREFKAMRKRNGVAE